MSQPQATVFMTGEQLRALLFEGDSPVLSDPNMVGSSEYRTVYEHLTSVCDSLIDDPEALAIALGSLDEMVGVIDDLSTRIKGAAGT